MFHSQEGQTEWLSVHHTCLASSRFFSCYWMTTKAPSYTVYWTVCLYFRFVVVGSRCRNLSETSTAETKESLTLSNLEVCLDLLFCFACLPACGCLFVFVFSFYCCISRILWFQAVTVYVEFMETNTPFVYFCLSHFMEARYWAQPKRIVVFVEETQQRGKRRVRFVNQLRFSKTWNKRNENLLEVVAGSINATIGHFWVSRGLCFKARLLSAKPLIWKRLFSCANVNETRYLKNVLHLASFWKWGFLELGNGPFTEMGYILDMSFCSPTLLSRGGRGGWGGVCLQFFYTWLESGKQNMKTWRRWWWL